MRATPLLSALPFFILQKFIYFKLFLMRLLYISERTLSQFEVSTDIPMSETEVKTSNVVNFV